MAWEDLLRSHSRREDGFSPASGADQRSEGSLIRQIAAMVGMTAAAEEAEEPAPAEPEEPEIYADGYVRRSPMQPYQTAADYRIRMIRKAVGIVLGLCLAALLAVALVRARVLRF